MSFNTILIANFSDSNDECYEAELARRHTEAEILLCQQEEKEHLECQACKEAKIVEQKRLEEETWRKEECQRDLAHHLEADCITTIEQQHRKNWTKTFLLPSTPPSNEEMNLLDLLPLTKRQRV